MELDRNSPLLWIRLYSLVETKPSWALHNHQLCKVCGNATYLFRVLTSWEVMRTGQRWKTPSQKQQTNTVRNITKQGHKWMVGESSVGQMHWKMKSLGCHSSKLEHCHSPSSLGEGKERSIYGSLSAHFLHRDGTLKTATCYSSPACKSILISLFLESLVSLNHIDYDHK